MTGRGRPVAGLLAVAALVSGCGRDYDEATARLDRSRTTVTAVVLEVADVLRGAGLRVTALRGRPDTCRSAPVTGVDYRVDGSVLGDDPVSSRLETAIEALTAAGWTLASRQRDPPGAVLTRGDQRLTLGRTTVRDRSGLAFGTRGACVRFPDDRVPDFSRVDAVPLR